MKGFAYQLVKTSRAVAACAIYPIQPQTWHPGPNTAQPANSAYNDLCILALLHSRERMPHFQTYWAKLLCDMLEVQLSLLPRLPLAYTHTATNTTRPEHEARLCLWEGWLQNQHYRENHRYHKVYTECMGVIWCVPIGGLWLCMSNKPLQPRQSSGCVPCLCTVWSTNTSRAIRTLGPKHERPQYRLSSSSAPLQQHYWDAVQ